MPAFLVNRFFQGILSIIVVTMIVFLLVRLSGDPAVLLLPPEAAATQEHLEQLRQSLGLKDPLPVQYARFAVGMMQGDFGISTRRGRPAISMVVERIPATAQLASVALLIAIVASIPLGVLSAFFRGSLIDRTCTVCALLGESFPNFWLGLMLILLFSVALRVVPPSGNTSLSSVVLPAVTLAAYPLAQLSLMIRVCLIEVLKQDYIRVARSKGLDETAILKRHASKNIAIPLITLIGLQARHLLAGSIIVETVFAWPGLGLLMIQAVETRDFPVLQAVVFFLAIVVVLLNLSVDILYAYLDPRVRLG